MKSRRVVLSEVAGAIDENINSEVLVRRNVFYAKSKSGPVRSSGGN